MNIRADDRLARGSIWRYPAAKIMEISQSPEAPTRTASISVPFRTVIASMVVLWGTYFILISTRSYLLDLDLQTEMMVRRAIVTLAAIGLTVVLWALLRLVDRQALWVKIGAASLFAIPIAVALGQINQYAFDDILQELEQRFAEERGLRFDDEGNLLYDLPAGVAIKAPNPDGSGADQASESLIIAPAEARQQDWRSAVEIALGRYFLLLAWSSTYFALLAGVQAHAAERREQQFRSAAKAAELRSLRYQVNPHFLFNTLNSLSALVLTSRTQAAEKMIQMLSTFYRRSLAEDTTADVPLREEVALQRLYLEIEGVRFPLRLVAEYDVPADLENALIPGMILQPLVENSVKHAVAPSSGQITIRISAREEYGRLVVSVSDNGNSRQVPDDVRPGFGIGLTNVRERLQARFGNAASIVSGHSAEGFTTHLRLPLLRMAEVVAA